MDQDTLESTIGLCNEIIERETNLLKNDFTQSIDLLGSFHGKHQEEKEKQPYHINLIDELHANENAHSRILVKLLQYKVGNNEYPILRSFLEYLSKGEDSFIFNHKVTKPIITAEKHRIDALVVDKDYAVIIENKIHGAVDQPEQIKRYIEVVKECKIAENSIYILYLTRGGSMPSEDSFPTLLRDKFTSRFKQISFRHDIIDWMKNEVAQLCETKEDYLNSARLQYIDHLEGMFHLRTIDKPMKDALTKHLETVLMLDGDPSQNVRILTEKIEDIDNIRIYLEELRLTNYFKSWAKQIAIEYPNYQLIERYNDLNNFPETGFSIKYKGIDLDLMIEKDENELYFGIAGKSPDLKVEIITFLESILIGYKKQENSWYGWKNTEYDRAYQDFRRLADAVLEKVSQE